MRWPSSDIWDLRRMDRIVGRYKRKFPNREGKKNCYFADFNEGIFSDDLEFDESHRTFKRKGGKVKKAKPIKLKGPPDIVCRYSFRKILKGEKLDYPFLTELENKILTKKALGWSWNKIAKRYSGGNNRRSLKASRVKNILHDCYDKIRLNEKSFRSNIPLHIQHKAVFEKYKYRLRRSKK